MAKRAKVILSWQKSISTDVVSQKVEVLLNGQPFISTELSQNAQEFAFEIPEKQLVHVEITAFDGTNSSIPAVLVFEVGDLTAPAPPTNLTYEIVEIFDDEQGPIEDPLG